jgi:predicted MFS family arabinose efflux permease
MPRAAAKKTTRKRAKKTLTKTSPRNHQRSLVAIYSVLLLLVFHGFVVAYINSSFLEQYVSAAAVGLIYTVGSAVSILIFLFISRVLRQVGNYRLTVGLLLVNLAAVSGLAFADSLRTAVPLFIIHLIALPIILFNLDVFLEEVIGGKENSTGSKRGLLLSLASFVGAVSPLVAGSVVATDGTDFSNAYYLSALTLVPVLAIVLIFFRSFKDPKYKEIHIMRALQSFWERPNIRYILSAHFLLQCFFFVMTIYVPLYLFSELGLGWQTIGILLFVGQLAYVTFEYPIGIVADTYLGEKELMAVGFLIIAAVTASFAYLPAEALVLWGLVMFLSRVGAALAEVTTESYFFKHMKASDAQTISFFRVTRPLAYVVGALLASAALLYLPFAMLFIVTALAMLPAVIFALRLNDTR